MAKVSPEERVKQFKEDLYVDGGVLFCKYCEHSIDYVRIDAIKDHLKSKKHASRKEAKLAKAGASSTASCSQQITLSTVVKSKDARQDFILDFVKMCTVADIPLKKTEEAGHAILQWGH